MKPSSNTINRFELLLPTDLGLRFFHIIRKTAIIKKTDIDKVKEVTVMLNEPFDGFMFNIKLCSDFSTGKVKGNDKDLFEEFVLVKDVSGEYILGKSISVSWAAATVANVVECGAVTDDVKVAISSSWLIACMSNSERLIGKQTNTGTNSNNHRDISFLRN